MIERCNPLFAVTQVTRHSSDLEECSMFWKMLNRVPSNVLFASRSFVVCVWRQRSSDQDYHIGKKSDNETCFQNPQSCPWLVIRSNQFGPKIQIKYIDTKNQLADILTKGNFTWRMESSVVFVQHQPFHFCRVFWSDVEKNAKRIRWRKSHEDVEPGTM